MRVPTVLFSLGFIASGLAACGGSSGDGGGGGGNPPPVIDVVAALVAPVSVVPGETFEYQVRFESGGGTAQAVAAELTLPDGVSIDAVSDGGTASGRVVTWPATASLAVGSSVFYTVSVTAPSVGPLNASVEVATTSDESDIANNASSARTVLGFDAIGTLDGEGDGDFYGFVADALGDLTGDGITEFIVGAPFNDAGGIDAGRAYVYSGADRALLFAVTGAAAGENLGWSVAAAGDVDGDGIGDVILGGPGAGAGVARVYSGIDGTPLGALAGPAPGARFGVIVAGVGDLDGDGRGDFVIGAEGAGANGQAFVVSGADGATIRSHAGATGSLYGSGAGAIGDVSGDGVADYAIGGGAGTGGFVEARSGADGTLLYTVEPEASGVQLGFIWIDAVGDVDGDGRPDFYAADINDTANRGRGYLVSGATGATIRTVTGEQGAEFFGIARHGGHDADGDGVADLFVAGYHNGEGAVNAGKAYVYSGASGALLRTMTSVTANETLGYDAVQLGDVDGDGLVDYLLTGDLETGQNPGRVHVVRGTPLP